MAFLLIAPYCCDFHMAYLFEMMMNSTQPTTLVLPPPCEEELSWPVEEDMKGREDAPYFIGAPQVAEVITDKSER